MKWFKSRHINITEEELLAKAKAEEDNEYASALFTRYLEQVYGVCMKYYKDTEKSKDAVMGIYERYLKKVKQHEVTNFKSWLYVMSKNYCLEKLRKENREREKLDKVVVMQSESIFHPYEEDEKEEMLVKLEACVAKLKQDQRKCIDLFYLQKKTYKEITEELELGWSRVRSLIQNGRRNLKNCIEAQ